MKYIFEKLNARWIALAMLMLFSIATIAVSPAHSQEITVYKTPSCGCCTKWVDHLAENGFEVTVQSLDDLSPVKSRLGVPRELQSCHTAEIDGYVIEGHVPAADIERLLEERPDATGIAVPGMPVGSPGMEYGARKDPYDVILFGGDEQKVYASH
jgi:hypothetical protein